MAEEPIDGSGPQEPVAKSPPAEGGKAKSKPKLKPAAAEAAGGKKQRGRPMRGIGKRHAANLRKVEAKKKYALDAAVKMLKEIAVGTKFDQTVNVVMHLGIDPKNAEHAVRGSMSLPKGIGKTKKVVAFCEGDEADKARAAGAIEAGLDDLIAKISGGWAEFDVAIAHPRSMGKVGKLGRVLGPQGKMPSPKSGTVTPDVETAVREFAAGKIEFRHDAGGNVHGIVGKASFSAADLAENIQAFIGHVRRLKPASSKGAYIKKVCISGTMSPAIELEVAQ